MSILSKILMTMNPIGPLNWIVGLILYFKVKKKLQKDDKKKWMAWPVFFLLYMIILIPLYYAFCAMSASLPGPLKLISAFCE